MLILPLDQATPSQVDHVRLASTDCRQPTTVEHRPAQLSLAQRLASRLERLSVDSRWARRLSGLRGNLLKAGYDIRIKGTDRCNVTSAL